MRRPVLRLVMVLIPIAVLGVSCYYLWFLRGPQGPTPPSVPADLTDPPILDIVEKKRQAVLANPKQARAWGELGMAFDAHESLAESATCYRQAMTLDPADARWPFLLAQQLNLRNSDATNKEEAVRLYRLASECPPPSPNHRSTSVLSLADLLTELGRGDEAAPLYQRAYDSDPTDAWAAYRVGTALALQGETTRASKILLGLARSPFARKKSAIAMAELTRRSGNAKEADGYDYASNLLSPDHSWANPFAMEVVELRRGRRVLMDTYTAQEGAQDDRAAVRTATSLADQYPSVETQMLLLRALVNAGDYPAAVAVAEDVLRDPQGRGLVTAHSFLGLAQLGLADRAEAEGRQEATVQLLNRAIESLRESVRLKPDYTPGYLYQAKALLRLDKLADAEKVARDGINCRPEEWESYLVLSEVLVAAGRKPEAVLVVEQAIKLANPNETKPKLALEALKK